MADNGKRFAQDFTRIDDVTANDAILVQDSTDGVVKFANPSQVLSYVSANGGFANAAAMQLALSGKQDTLTLTTLSNGNIRIGNLAGTTQDFMPATPSGDPMHYAYEAVGAVWNASTGYWQLNGINDLTNANMRAIYELGNSRIYRGALLIDYFRGNRVRTNIPANVSLSSSGVIINNMATSQSNLEVVKLAAAYAVKVSTSTTSSVSYAFNGCTNLQEIANILDFSGVTTCDVYSFRGCSSLTTLQITGLKCDISLESSPNLSKASILYMVENAGTATITITLHATAYAMAMADSDIQNALESKTNVSLASA